jgi:hypothetical protein
MQFSEFRTSDVSARGQLEAWRPHPVERCQLPFASGVVGCRVRDGIARVQGKMVQKRLERAAAFVAELYFLSIANSESWRRAESAGEDVGLTGAELELALKDAEQASLILRREDDAGSIILTEVGQRLASRH